MAPGEEPQERSPRRRAAGCCSRVHKNGYFMSRTASTSLFPRQAGPWMGQEGQEVLLAPFFGGGAGWRDGGGEAGAEGMSPGLSTLHRTVMPLTVPAPQGAFFLGRPRSSQVPTGVRREPWSRAPGFTPAPGDFLGGNGPKSICAPPPALPGRRTCPSAPTRPRLPFPVGFYTPKARGDPATASPLPGSSCPGARGAAAGMRAPPAGGGASLCRGGVPVRCGERGVVAGRGGVFHRPWPLPAPVTAVQ